MYVRACGLSAMAGFAVSIFSIDCMGLALGIIFSRLPGRPAGLFRLRLRVSADKRFQVVQSAQNVRERRPSGLLGLIVSHGRVPDR